MGPHNSDALAYFCGGLEKFLPHPTNLKLWFPCNFVSIDENSSRCWIWKVTFGFGSLFLEVEDWSEFVLQQQMDQYLMHLQYGIIHQIVALG